MIEVSVIFQSCYFFFISYQNSFLNELSKLSKFENFMIS